MLGDLFVSIQCRFLLCAMLIVLGGSMTLVGLLPPLCDNGSMLVDGGYG